MGEADVEALERGYAALNCGDLSVVLDLLDPDIEWHEPGWSPEAGAISSDSSVRGAFCGWASPGCEASAADRRQRFVPGRTPQ